MFFEIVFGIFVGSLLIQIIFWLIAGIWGLTHTQFRFREILQTLRRFREGEYFHKEKGEVES